MDINEFAIPPQGLQPQGESQKISSSSPSKKATVDEPSFPHSEGTRFDDDLLKEFDKKHTELSTFLQDIPPSGSSNVEQDRMSVSPQDLLGGSPGKDLPRGTDISNATSAIVSSADIFGDDDDPFGLQLGGSNEKDVSPKHDEISFGKVNGKTEGEGSDAKLLQDLLDQANNFGGDISPDSLHTDDLLGLDKSPVKSIKDDQVVPPAGISKDEELNIHTLPRVESSNLMDTDTDSMFDRSSASPMEFDDPKLPESPCFKPPSPIVTSVRADSPKLPETPCFKPPSPEVTTFMQDSSQEKHVICDDFVDVEPAKSDPEVMISHNKPNPVEELGFSPLGKSIEDYTRRETKTFDNDDDDLIGTNKYDNGKKISHQEFGGGDLPPSRNIILDQDDDVPPPIPKHSWEIEKEIPPPVPPHSIVSDYSSVGFHSAHASNDFPIHASYDDKIDDEFDEDSLSKPLSHKLSDSLEVLKESPQKEHPTLDESLMDLDDLPSSSKNSVQSISPNDSKNILGDFSGADGDVSAPITSLPSEMTESGLFSQQPPKDLDSDSLDIDERIDYKQVADMDYTATATNKPIASITPFSAKGEGVLGDAPLASTMTSSMIMNTSLDEMQAPKFYESEDSSSKTDAPADEMEKAQTEPDRNLELQEFDDAIPESLEESGTPASDSGSSKIEVLEIKPTVKAEPVEEVQPETKVVQPKQRIELDTEAFELSEEMQLLLNILKPRAWFDPSKLHPVVSELVYWRDPKKSGAVFGSILVVLLALSLMSLISVVAYTSLAVLSGTFAFRVYKSVLQAVQKTQDGHPFKEYLDLDIAVPSDKAQELSNAIINYANSAILQLRRLFLVEDLVDSGKFGLVLYLLTYIGGWFNGLTLLILGFVALFALPKVYETNKAVIDQYLELINSKIAEVTAKVTTAVPFLKKEKAQ